MNSFLKSIKKLFLNQNLDHKKEDNTDQINVTEQNQQQYDNKNFSEKVNSQFYPINI